jgi:transcriptional regulator with XRE-family HTH domain
MAKKVIVKKEVKLTAEDQVEHQIKNLGARIKQLRIAKGYTNAEFFAYDHKINRSQYGKYERGEDLRFSSLVRIIQIHNLTLPEFFSDGFEV